MTVVNDVMTSGNDVIKYSTLRYEQRQPFYTTTSSEHGRDLKTSENMFLGMINITTALKSGNNKVQFVIILLGNSGRKPCAAHEN